MLYYEKHIGPQIFWRNSERITLSSNIRGETSLRTLALPSGLLDFHPFFQRGQMPPNYPVHFPFNHLPSRHPP